METGKRDDTMMGGPEDRVDEGLLAKLQNMTFAGCSDGAAVALAGIQELKCTGRLPKLRYQFRDRPHTTRTCMKGTLKCLQEGEEHLEL